MARVGGAERRILMSLITGLRHNSFCCDWQSIPVPSLVLQRVAYVAETVNVNKNVSSSSLPNSIQKYKGYLVQ